MISATHSSRSSNGPSQPSVDSSDLFDIQQERILGAHFQKDREIGAYGDSSEYVDSLLVKEFTNMTVQERSKTYDELHGVRDCVEETPDILQNSLWQLDEELSRISEKVAYNIAKEQNLAYVNDTKFRLMFLRATGFDPRKAAIRLVAFFEGKLRFFGGEMLTKQIQFSDLDEDDKVCLRAGHMQVLPCRDRSGRPILTDVGVLHDRSYKIPSNRLKAAIFYWLMMAEDEENQKRGVVVIVMQMGAVDLSKIDPELPREFPKLDKWLPLRVSAVHLCTDHPMTSFVWRTTMMGSSRETRLRHCIHLEHLRKPCTGFSDMGFR